MILKNIIYSSETISAREIISDNGLCRCLGNPAIPYCCPKHYRLLSSSWTWFPRGCAAMFLRLIDLSWRCHYITRIYYGAVLASAVSVQDRLPWQSANDVHKVNEHRQGQVYLPRWWCSYLFHLAGSFPKLSEEWLGYFDKNAFPTLIRFIADLTSVCAFSVVLPRLRSASFILNFSRRFFLLSSASLHRVHRRV